MKDYAPRKGGQFTEDQTHDVHCECLPHSAFTCLSGHGVSRTEYIRSRQQWCLCSFEFKAQIVRKPLTPDQARWGVLIRGPGSEWGLHIVTATAKKR